MIYQNKMIIYVVLARYYREGKRRGAFFYNDVSRKKEDESEGKKWREEGERKESAGRRQIFSTTTLSHSTFTFLSFFPLRLARSLNFSFSLSFSLEKAGEASQEETKRKRLESRAQLTPPPFSLSHSLSWLRPAENKNSLMLTRTLLETKKMKI